MKRYVLFNRNAFRTDDGAGYWNDQDGWTTLDGATVFAEHELSDGTVRAMEAVRVPAPPLRLTADEAASSLSRLQVGDLVWVHAPESAALQSGQPADVLLDGYFTWLGSAGEGLAMLADPNGWRFAFPQELLLPTPLASAVDGVRGQLDDAAKVFAYVDRDARGDWVCLRVPSGWPSEIPPTGWAFARTGDATVLRAEAPLYVDWPVRFVDGDVVAYRDVDAGACSGLAVWVAPEEGSEPDPEHARILIAGEVQDVPRHHVHPTPYAHARQEVEGLLAQCRIGGEVRVMCAGVPAEGAEATLQIRVECKEAQSPQWDVIKQAAQRAGFSVVADGDAIMLAKTPDCDREPWMSDDDMEAWGLITPDEGGFFEVEDVEEAPACTVWAVIEADDEALTLRAGYRRFDAVLGYVRTERPWSTEAERAIWLPGNAGGEPEASPSGAAVVG